MIPKRLIIITGLSGSGKSTAARALEDEGFFVVDNLPLILLPRFLQLARQEGGGNPDIAVVVDVRTREFLTDCEDVLQKARDAGYGVEIYFFDAADEDLIRRFSETRRRHPLVENKGLPHAILKEREVMAELKKMATAVFDSSGLTVHQLRRKFVKFIYGNAEKATPLVVHLQSFGFRYGVPLESDLVIDVRFLPNPHYVDELRPLTGLDPAVSHYVLSQQSCREFLGHIKGLLKFLLPKYRKEGKSYLTVSIGCTGGHHRSVAIAEELGPCFTDEGLTLDIIHRDIAKG